MHRCTTIPSFSFISTIAIEVHAVPTPAMCMMILSLSGEVQKTFSVKHEFHDICDLLFAGCFSHETSSSRINNNITSSWSLSRKTNNGKEKQNRKWNESCKDWDFTLKLGFLVYFLFAVYCSRFSQETSTLHSHSSNVIIRIRVCCPYFHSRIKYAIYSFGFQTPNETNHNVVNLTAISNVMCIYYTVL